VDLTIQGWVRFVLGLRRFSVRETLHFSWALPMTLGELLALRFGKVVLGLSLVEWNQRYSVVLGKLLDGNR
jgi:hypothetical protein